VVDGFFVHFFAPESAKLKAGPKEIIFVLDKSGSMHGTKFDQTKAAMKKILSELREEDRFNIIMFSSGVQVKNIQRTVLQDLNDFHETDYLNAIFCDFA